MFSRKPRTNNGVRVPASPVSPPLSFQSTVEVERNDPAVKHIGTNARFFGRKFRDRSGSLTETSKRDPSEYKSEQSKDAGR